MQNIVIVGGGASGIILAAQLLRKSASVKIILISSAERLGEGIAYSTQNPSHLLNVRAGNMSAFADQPLHFVEWLQQHPDQAGAAGSDASSFVPRMVYAHYLRSLLQDADYQAAGRLTIIHDMVVDSVATPDGAGLALQSGRTITADQIVLATGNEPGTARVDFWKSQGRIDLPVSTPVIILGTGLSMIDATLSLLDNGHLAPIHALSRRGLLPQSHAAVAPLQLAADSLPWNRSLSGRLHWFRREFLAKAIQEGHDWRSAMDALRPHTRRLWQSLTFAEKQRFMRHLRPWWDVHRHRMAPQIAARIEAARASGQLQIHAGSIETDQAPVTYRARHSQARHELPGATVIDCRGGQQAFNRTDNPLLQQLLRSGQILADETNLGMKITDELRVISTVAPAAPIHVIGPISRAKFWESTAIPDIRLQADQLSDVLAALAPAN